MIPEAMIYNILVALLKEVKDDYLRHTRPEDTLLYHLYGKMPPMDGKYNYFNEAVDLFTKRDASHPRELKVNMMYNAGRQNLPTIHITLPSEMSEHNSIGVGEGGLRAQDFVSNQMENTVTPLYRRNFQTMFHIICTSDSSQEVLLMYHTLKALLVSVLDFLNIAGLQDPKLSGQDITQMDHLAPPSIFRRGIGLSCFYEVTAPRYFDGKVINDIIMTATPVATGSVTVGTN